MGSGILILRTPVFQMHSVQFYV